MRNASPIPENYFVDEAGDPVFYNAKGNLIVGTEGCSKILIIGYIRTANPVVLRNKLREVTETIRKDKYLAGILSVKDSIDFFHAKDDCPEVRHLVYNAIKDMNFKAEFVVARKHEDRFKKNHLGKESIFYDDIVARLFQSRMHVSQASKIYFAVRGNKNRQVPLSDAIQVAKNTFEIQTGNKVNTIVDVVPQSMSGEPCLQITDYMLWALHRAYTKRDMRYFNFVKNKVSFVWDIYDPKVPAKKNRYHSKNPFDIKKTSPL